MKYSVLLAFLTLTLGLAGILDAEKSSAATLAAAGAAYDASIPALPPPEPTGAITLETAVEAAVGRHPSLAVTRYEIEARKGAVQQAGLPPNPVLFGEMEEFAGSGDFSGSTALSARLGISRELVLGGKTGKRVREAEAAAGVAELEHRARIVEIAALVEKRFLAVFTSQERLRLQTEGLDLIRQSHEVVAKRVRAGDTSPLDLARSQVDLATAQIALEQSRMELETARYSLAETWGSTVPAFAEVSFRYHSEADFNEADLQEALRRSPVWRLQEEQGAVAEATLELATAQKIPDIELEGGVQRFNESDDHAFFVGFSIPLPLFDRNQGNIAEARAARQKARHAGEAAYLALRTELRLAWREVLASRRALQALENEVMPSASQAYEAIGKGYRAGATDILGLLDARRTWLATRASRLDLLHRLENGLIEIKRLTADGALPAAASSDTNANRN